MYLQQAAGAGAALLYGGLAILSGPMHVPGVRNVFEGTADLLPGLTGNGWYELGTFFGL